MNRLRPLLPLLWGMLVFTILAHSQAPVFSGGGASATPATSSALGTVQLAPGQTSSTLGSAANANTAGLGTVVPTESTTAPAFGANLTADGVGGIHGGPWVFTSTAAWASGTLYGVNAAATSGGNVYGSLVAANQGNTPSSSPAQWKLIPPMSKVVMAASNSLDYMRADFQCSGTNDDQCINAILSYVLPSTSTGATNQVGGRLEFEAGKYIPAATITFNKDSVSVIGQVWGFWDHYLQPWQGIASPSGVAGYAGVDFVPSGTGYPTFTLSYTAGHCHPLGGSDNRCGGIHMENLHFTGNAFNDTAIYSTAFFDSMTFSGITINQYATPINVNADSAQFDKLNIQSNSGGSTFSGVLTEVSNSLIFDNGGACISMLSNGGKVYGNRCGDASAGVVVTGAGSTSSAGASISVTDNVFGGIAGKTLAVTGCPGCRFSGNTIDYRTGAYGFGYNLPQYSGTYATSYSSDVVSIDAASTGAVIGGNQLILGQPLTGHFINAASANGANIYGNTVVGIASSPFLLGSNASTANVNTANCTNNGPVTITSGTLLFDANPASITGVTSGTAVNSSLADECGAGYSFSPVTTSPTYIASSPINSLPAIQFNGTSDILVAPGGFFPVTQPRTIWAVVDLTNTASALGRNVSIINSDQPAVSGNPITNAFTVSSSGNSMLGYAGTAVVSNSTAIAASIVYCIEEVVNGANSYYSVNGVKSSTFNPGAFVWAQGVTLGANGAQAGEWMPGYLGRAMSYSGQLSSADANAVGAYMHTTYGCANAGSW